MSGDSSGDPRWERHAAGVPARPGVYMLALWLPQGAHLPPRLADRGERPALPPGWVVYAGSARGPGGLRARLGRHLQATKTRRWHVDWLTTAPGVRAWVRALPGSALSECDLVAQLLARPGASSPVAGFGASDCRTCAAHLVALAASPPPAAAPCGTDNGPPFAPDRCRL